MTNHKQQKKVNIISFLLWSLLALGGTYTFASGATLHQGKISLSTMEFDNYRRIILTSPSEGSGHFIAPQIEDDPENGEFTLIFSPLDSASYIGKRLTKEYGTTPIQLTVSFPDSQTLKITGKSLRFDKLVGYYQLGEERYIFDIYTDSPHESFFNEASISTESLSGYTEDGRFKIVTGFPPPGKYTSAGFLSPKAHFWPRLKMSLLYTFYLGAMIMLLSLGGIYGRKYFPKMSVKSDNLKEHSTNPITALNASKKNLIKSIMSKYGLSYEEAMIRLALTNQKLDVKV